MTIDEVSKLLMENNPRTANELKALGIQVRTLGSGAYRHAYKVLRLPLVIKIPFNQRMSLKHAEAEIKAIRQIIRLKKYRKLKKYMPNIYFYNPKTRVIGMEYCTTKINPYLSNIELLLNDLLGEIWPDAATSSVDVHRYNIGFNRNGDIKIIDLGYFSEKGRGWSS